MGKGAITLIYPNYEKLGHDPKKIFDIKTLILLYYIFLPNWFWITRYFVLFFIQKRGVNSYDGS